MRSAALFHRSMEYVDIPNVPLVKVGTWNGSTGAKAITQQDLADMVEAGQSRMLDLAVIKKGHNDPRHMNPMWDGEPVYGQVDDLHLADGGNTLLGTLKRVPKDLAESMPSAYPNRSVEIAWDINLRDAAGKVARKFRAALSGLALLGATPPAVKGLGGPRSATAFSAQIGSMDTYSMAPAAVTHLSGPALYTALNDAVLQRLGVPEESGVMVTSMSDAGVADFKTPNGTYRVNYTVGTDNTIALSETLERLEGKTVTIPHTGGGGTHAENDPSNTSGEKEPTVAFNKELREKLGLPETATEAEVLEKIGSGTQFAAGENTVIVSKEAFEELQTKAVATETQLSEVLKDRDKERRDGLIETFSQRGLIHPKEAEYWRGQLDKDEAATVQFMETRTPVIPVTELGAATAFSTQPTTDDMDADTFKAVSAALGINL